MNGLADARKEIDQVDVEMARLFERRMHAVEAVAEYKATHGLPVKDSDREQIVIKRNSAYVENDAIRAYYISFMTALMDVSKQYQSALLSGVRVAYCGVEGAFANIAAKRIFPEGQLCSYPDFATAYQSVNDGACDCCVLPIENSFAGEVGSVLDLMFEGALFVNGVYDLRVRQHLLGILGASPAGIKKVLSHPQALQQCAEFIRRNGLVAESATNTAVAAKTVAQLGDPTVGAIASMETASLYNLKVLDHDVNESVVNTTRFAVFSRSERARTNADERFLLLFTVNNVVGALAKAVNIICAHGFNMRVLRSRPVKNVPWQYYFYVEAEGDANSDEGRRMLTELRICCDRLKVVGHYAADLTVSD